MIDTIICIILGMIVGNIFYGLIKMIVNRNNKKIKEYKIFKPLPCPCCGNKDINFICCLGDYIVYCNRCNYTINNKYKTCKEALSYWNEDR